MEVISLSQKQLDSLTRLSLSHEITNTESEIYILDHGRNKYSNDNLLLKKLYITCGSSMANKLYNVSLLGDNKDEIGVDELVIPKHLVAIKRQISAFTIPNIEGVNLGTLLHNTKIPNQEKIEYLYKIGKLLKRTKKLKIQNLPFHFGDLHEYNFLLGNDGKTYAVDLDSCYLNTSNPQPSYYLTVNKNLSCFPTKYKANSDGIIYPSYNTDLLCYNMIILNTIGRDKISSFDMSTYYEYTNYLKSLGFGKDIIHCFHNIYSSAKNINPCEYLDQIPEDKIGEAGAKIFKLKKEKGLI